MDELTIAWCWAHLWLHVYRSKSHCSLCAHSTRTAKPWR